MSEQEQANEWFLARDGQQHGPLSDVEIRKVAELGHLRPTDLVWRQGLANWVLATSVFAAAAQAPPPRVTAPHAGAPRGDLEPAGGPRAGDPRSVASRTGADAAGYAPAQHLPPRSATPAPQSYAPGGQPTAQPAARHAPHPAANPLDPRNRIVYAEPQSASATLHAPGPQGAYGAGAYEPPHGREHRPGANGHIGQPTPDDAYDQPRRFPWVRIAVVMVFAVAIGAGAAFYFKGAVSFGSLTQIFAGLTSDTSTSEPPVVRAPREESRVVASTVGRGGGDASPIVTASSTPPSTAPPEALPVSLGNTANEVDAALQKARLWRLLKTEFADWYTERVQEVVRAKAQRKDDAAIAGELSQALIKLRRDNADAALSASPTRLQAVAASFVDNLDRLAKHSTEACYGYISAGETDPLVAELMRSSELAAPLQAQLAAIFEAIADGRRSPRKHPQVLTADFDALAAHLAQRGWGPQDLQLFSDARALSRATPLRVCKMVRDWFTAQLDVKDEAVQVRLLVETLKPVVSG